jgi:hypothetical protein
MRRHETDAPLNSRVQLLLVIAFATIKREQANKKNKTAALSGVWKLAFESKVDKLIGILSSDVVLVLFDVYTARR